MQVKTAAGRTWLYTHSIGHHVGPHGFTHPTPVLTAPGGVVYVADTGAAEGYAPAKIHKFTIDGEYINGFGVEDLTWPEGLALDADGYLYCSDAHGHFIVIYSPDGQKIGQWGEHGAQPGQLGGPAGLAFDRDGNLLVVDGQNHRVQRFTRDGHFISAWGSYGSAAGEFDRPWGIAVDSKGDIYVADWGNDRVQQFTPDGVYVRRFGSRIDDGGRLRRPVGVAIDSEGDVYVLDWGNHRIQIYYPDGDIISGLYGDAREFSESARQILAANPDYVRAFERVDPEEMITLGRFERPRGIAIDDQNRILVTDGTRGRVQVYAKDKEYRSPQFNL